MENTQKKQPEIIRLTLPRDNYDQELDLIAKIQIAITEAGLKLITLEKISQTDHEAVFQLTSQTGVGQVVLQALSGMLPANKIEVNRDRDGYALLTEVEKNQLTNELAETITHLALSLYVNRGEKERYTQLAPDDLKQIVKQATKLVTNNLAQKNQTRI